MKTFLVSVLIVLLTQASHALPDEANDIINSINRQMNLPLVTSNVKMVTVKEGRKKTYEFQMFMAVYPDSSEKALVLITVPKRSKGIRLLVERKRGDITVRFIRKDGKPFRSSSSRQSSIFMKSLLRIADFAVLEDVANYSFELGSRNRIVAESKNPERTFYSKRIIRAEKMDDGSWIEREVEYFDGENSLKSSVNSDFVEVAPRCRRPRKIVISDGENTTTLNFKDWKVSGEIPEHIFRF